MRDFFGTRWDDLTVDDVEAFLIDAGDEGLTWEAKGGEHPPRKDAIRKGVCGFANAIGGFFVIGADRSSEGWTLPGVAFEVDEPATWLSSVIADGLRPSPFCDVKVFDRAEGRQAAVILVEELAVPPCVTASGIVYQRVSGQTLPVTDQRVLAELIGRGRAARDEAEALAVRAGLRALEEPGILGPEAALVSVALCPAQSSGDKTSVLFSQAFAEGLMERVRRDLQPDSVLSYPPQLAVRQDSVSSGLASRELGQSCMVTAYWDGSVSSVYTTSEDDVYVSELIPRVKWAWKALVAVAAELGGVGSAHLVITVRGEHASVAKQKQRPTTPTRRWTELREPTEDELGAVERELRRGFGDFAWEPAG